MAETLRNALSCCLSPPKHDEDTNRERWDSRSAFILAACGAAIGLGNLWRFPQLAFAFGGGAFFIPYLMALFFIGIPIAVLELALGQVVQSGDIACFGSMHRRLRGIGFASVFGAFVVVCYYNVIIVWALVYLVNSFKSPLPWDIPDDAEGLEIFAQGTDFFENHVLQVTGLDSPAEFIVGNNFGALLFTWLFIAAIVYKGVSRTSKVVYFTMLVPLITILIMFFRGVTLEGADVGIKQYIGQWDVAVLSDGTAWSRAVAQIFFSIGVTFGIMTAYSSYNSRHQNVVSDALIISLTNSGVSFVAGFAVFSVLGWLSVRSGIPMTDENFPDVGGTTLAFATYPQALAELPGANFFNFLFFLTLFLLGIDSAFSMVEAVSTAVKDSSKYNHVSRGMITCIIMVLGLLIGCLYITNIGPHFLDQVDAYINSAMIVIGFMECFSSAYIYRIEEHIQISGAIAVWTLMAAWIGSAALAVIIGTASGIGWVGLLVGLLLCVILSGVACHFAEHNVSDGVDEVWRNSGKLMALFFFPIESLRADLNAVIKKEGPGLEPEKKIAIPFVWSVFIRYFIPPVLVIMFGLDMQGYAVANGLGDPVTAKYHIVGVFSIIAVCLMVFIPAIFPQLLDGWIPATLSGVQSFGVLKPVRAYGDDEEESVEALTKKKEEVSDTLSVSVDKGHGEEVKTEEVELEIRKKEAQAEIDNVSISSSENSAAGSADNTGSSAETSTNGSNDNSPASVEA